VKKIITKLLAIIKAKIKKRTFSVKVKELRIEGLKDLIKKIKEKVTAVANSIEG